MNGFILAVIIVSGLGLLIGLFLGFSEKVFKVEVDEREEEIVSVLPGNNCGGCGFAGCTALANAIVNGNAKVNACPVGGEAVGKKVAEIMGVEAKEGEKEVAFVFCNGTNDNANLRYNYSGDLSCKQLAKMQFGGNKVCSFGCLGLGDCKKACAFDAIRIINGVSVVDKDKCKACKKCISACPKNIISLVPYDNLPKTLCSSKAKGKEVMDACKVGCIGCGLCAKECPKGAITMENNLPVKDNSKCDNCGICKEKCPKKCIK